MMKKLHKLFFVIVIATLSAIQMNAQGPYTFSTGVLDSWTSGFGSAVGISYTPSEGITGDGALKLIRTSNNSNIGYNQGVDADTYKFIKIRYKNTTSANTFRVQGSKDAANVDKITNTSFAIASNMSEYMVTYLDMTGVTNWSGTVLNLDILVRANYGLTDELEGILFDEIEFVASMPPTQYSEYIQNPSFDGPSGIDHLSGGKTFVTRGLTYTEFHDGDQSLKMSFTADADSSFWNFSNYEKVYGSKFIAGSGFKIKMWVRTNRTAPIKLSARLSLTDGGVATATKPIASVTTTNTTMEWEELTFSIEAGEDFDGVTFWFAVDYTDGEPTNLLSGDVVYIDELSATIDVSLSNKKNTLDGVSVTSNKDVFTVIAPLNSEVKVFDITGSNVISVKSTKESTSSINISSLASGVYIIKIVNKGKFYTKKVIVD